jgi:hypothetical protein
VTATGETVISPVLDVAYGGGTNNPNMATRVFLVANVTGVTNVHLWRTYVDNGHSYDMTMFPAGVGLLATVSPQATYYDDWESTAEFAARVTATVPPLYNTTAGQLLSSNGNPQMFVTDSGLQIYNFTTQKWYTLLNTGNPPQWGMDAGNPN